MRTTTTIGLLLLLSAVPAAGQASARGSVVLHVPSVLELTAEREASATRTEDEVRLRIRANVPWRLTVGAEATSAGGPAVEGPGDVRIIVSDATAHVTASEEVAWAGWKRVEVARSATRGEAVVAVRVVYPRGHVADRPRLVYSLAELD